MVLKGAGTLVGARRARARGCASAATPAWRRRAWAMCSPAPLPASWRSAAIRGLAARVRRDGCMPWPATRRARGGERGLARERHRARAAHLGQPLGLPVRSWTRPPRTPKRRAARYARARPRNADLSAAIYLSGDLGAGKTTWTRGFLRGLRRDRGGAQSHLHAPRALCVGALRRCTWICIGCRMRRSSKRWACATGRARLLVADRVAGARGPAACLRRTCA